MSDGEHFNQKRMDKCMKVAGVIIDNFLATKNFTYTIRATHATNGLSLGDLRKQYFSVGVGNDLTELPFVDTLVVFSFVEQQVQGLLAQSPKTGANFKVQVRITTLWPDEEAAKLISRMRIETPFDPYRFLQVVSRKCLDLNQKTIPILSDCARRYHRPGSAARPSARRPIAERVFNEVITREEQVVPNR